MLFHWLERRRRRQQLAEADADTFMEGYGDRAYDEMRRRVREADQRTVIDGNRDRGHWQRVGGIIARRSGKTGLDTATRYLERK